MKKIKLLFLSAIFILSAVCTDAKTIRFAVASDIHYSPIKYEDSARDISNAAKALGGFVNRVNENNYDYVIFLGDSIDKSKPESLLGFFKTIKNLNTPYYMVLGNHDVHKVSGMTKQEFLDIVSKHNPNQKKAQGSYYFYPTPDVVVIILDGASSGMPSSHGIFNQETLKWFDETLTKNKDKTAIVFQHFPYVPPFDSPTHEILEKNEYRAVINRHDNIFMICSGHYHKESVHKDEKGVYHISAPALFIPPYDYQEIDVSYDKKPFEKAKNFSLDGRQKPSI